MRILIDATTADPTIRVFGMSLVERLLHSMRRSPLDPEEIRILVRPQHEDVDPTHPIRRAIQRRALDATTITRETR